MEKITERLGQLRHLRAEAELLAGRILELEDAAMGGVQHITGMPRGSGTGDKVGRMAAMIADLRTQLDERRRECLDELMRLYGFIEGIEDSLTRQVMIYRYVDGMTWQKIAAELGETDEQYPRRLHNKFLKNAKFDENDESSVL